MKSDANLWGQILAMNSLHIIVQVLFRKHHFVLCLVERELSTTGYQLSFLAYL